MLFLIQKLLSSESFDDAVAMATLLQTLAVMVSTLGAVSCFCSCMCVGACHFVCDNWLCAVGIFSREKFIFLIIFIIIANRTLITHKN